MKLQIFDHHGISKHMKQEDLMKISTLITYTLVKKSQATDFHKKIWSYA